MRDGCVFCEIAIRRRASEVVYEDEDVVAFLCEPPATWGHLLVVPREHVADIWSIDGAELQRVMGVAHRLSLVLRRALDAKGINLRLNSGTLAGQDVHHLHVHVVPRYTDDTVLPGCVWGVPPWEAPSGGDERRGEVASAIRAALE